MLGNIALRGTDGIDDILNAGLLVTEDAKNFQAKWMRDGFQRAGRQLDMLLLFNITI